MKCPGGGDCFDLDCVRSGECQGYDVTSESITVTHTVVRNRRRRTAVASLSFGGGYQPRKHDGDDEPLPPPRKL